MGYGEDYISSSKDWSYDGQKIVRERKCKCGRGRILDIERSYSSEKTLRPDEVYSDTLTYCEFCLEVEKKHRDFCKAIRKEYSDKFTCAENNKKDIIKSIEECAEANISYFKFSSKKEFYMFLCKYQLNGYGALSTFRKETSGVNLEQLIYNHIHKDSRVEFIKCIYEYLGVEMPESLRDLIEKFNSIKVEIHNIFLEKRKIEDNKLEEIRKELENIWS